MKIMLYSSYSTMPNSDVLKMFDHPPKTCLFCAYADENAPSYVNRAKQHLSQVFDTIVDLTPKTNLNQKFDCIFVNGGVAFELIYKLKKYNQFDKIKKMVEDGALYIGNSAGSEVCSKDIMFVNEYEPPNIPIDIEENRYGFGFVEEKVLVEASRLGYSKKHGLFTDSRNYHNYLVYKTKYKDSIKIGNNAVAIINNGEIKVKKYPWKKIVEMNQKEEK